MAPTVGEGRALASAASHAKAKKKIKESSTLVTGGSDLRKEDIDRANKNLPPVLQFALDWIYSYLVVHPDQILLCKGNLESGAIQAQKVAEAKQAQDADTQVAEVLPDYWHKTYTTCKSIPKYYLSHWLVDGPAGMRSCDVDAIDGYSPGCALRRLFEWLTGLGETTWWAPALHYRATLTVWLGRQFENLGGPERMQVLKNAVDFDTGRVDWEMLTPFVFVYSAEINEDTDYSSLPPEEIPYLKTISHKFIPNYKAPLKTKTP